MFRIIAISDEQRGRIEQLGTKPKFWFLDDASSPYLFKEGRPNTGDDWAEKVACELCQLIDLPHVAYEFAMWKGRKGVVSPNLVSAGDSLILGNQLLAEIVPEYQATRFFRATQYTLLDVLLILSTDDISDRNPRIRVPIGWTGAANIDNALDVFMGYLMLDTWIANQDRHHENWGLVVTSEAKIHLAPSYDHASSLGSNETDANRKDRLITRDRRRSIERYVERATSAFYDALTKKPIPTVEAFLVAGKRNPKAALSWLDRLRQVTFREIAHIFAQIPDERITPIAAEFAQKMLELNRERLLRLQETLS